MPARGRSPGDGRRPRGSDDEVVVRPAGLQALPSAPELLVAGDGRWGTGITLPNTAGRTRLTACLEQVAAPAERDVAVEVLWPGRVFVGVRWGLAELPDALAGAERARVAVRAGAPRPVEAALLALLGSTPTSEPEIAELGAVRAWQSVGPLTLWRRGEVAGSRRTAGWCTRRSPRAPSGPARVWTGAPRTPVCTGLVPRRDRPAVHRPDLWSAGPTARRVRRAPSGDEGRRGRGRRGRRARLDVRRSPWRWPHCCRRSPARHRAATPGQWR